MNGLQIMTRHTISLVLIYMRLKTTTRYHFTPARLTELRNAFEAVEQQNFYTPCGWECKLVEPLLKTIWHHLTFSEPAIPFLGSHSSETLPLVQKDT